MIVRSQVLREIMSDDVLLDEGPTSSSVLITTTGDAKLEWQLVWNLKLSVKRNLCVQPSIPSLSLKEDLVAEEHLGYIIEREFDLVTPEELEATYDIKAADSGLSWMSFDDEVGSKIQAVPIAVGKGHRRLRVFNTGGLKAHEWLHHGANQLRRGQAAEIRDLFRSDMRSCAETPKIFFGKGAMTVQDLEKRMAEKKDILEAERQEKMKLAKLEQQAGMAMSDETKDTLADKHTLLSDSDGDPEAQEPDFEKCIPLLPSQRVKLQKESLKRKKDRKPGTVTKDKDQHKVMKGIVKTKNQAARGSSTMCPATLSAGAAAVEVDTSSANLTADLLSSQNGFTELDQCDKASTSGHSMGTAGSVKTKKLTYMNQVDIGKILGGTNLGDKMYNLKRQVEQMAREAKTPEDHAETNALRHHHELAVLAKEQGQKKEVMVRKSCVEVV